jgi:hypothetical protein
METKIPAVLKYLNRHMLLATKEVWNESGLSMRISAPSSLHHQSLFGWATERKKLKEKNSFVSML